MIKELHVVYNDFFDEPRENAEFLSKALIMTRKVNGEPVVHKFSEVKVEELLSQDVSVFIDYLSGEIIVAAGPGRFVIPSDVAIALKPLGNVRYMEGIKEFPDRWNVSLHFSMDMEDIPAIKMTVSKFMKKMSEEE